MNILLDTSFICSLHLPEDSLHKKAIVISQNIASEKTNLFISNFIMLEILTILSQRKSRQLAIEFGRSVRKEGSIKIIRIDEILEEFSWQIFQKSKEKDLSFADCSTLAVLEKERIDYLITFDKLFNRFQSKFHFKIIN